MPKSPSRKPKNTKLKKVAPTKKIKVDLKSKVNATSQAGLSTEEKLSAIRQQMAKHHLDAYWVPSGDEHINEYLPEENKRREWLTGFTGSAGDALIACETAWVFVDSRYYEQADYEVDLKYVRVSKLGLEGHPRLTEQIQKLASSLKESKKKIRIGFDPFTIPLSTYWDLEKAMAGKAIEWVPVDENLVDTICSNRANPALQKVFHLPVKYTGQSTKQKLAELRKAMAKVGADVLPATKLDQIAWLFNLRGQDIPYNPVFMSYAIITSTEAILFCESKRIEAKAVSSLKDLATIQPYKAYANSLVKLSKNKKVLIDSKHTTLGTDALVTASGGFPVYGDNPIELSKACKNETELAWMRNAHLQSGRGKIRAFHWLTEQLAQKRPVSEASFAEQLEAFYKQEPDFMGLSFNTIAGAGANSSIVHYGTPNPKRFLKAGEFFLVDSGIQCWGGTTDDTRTLIVGKPDKRQKQVYTAVLKAHIACASQVFPKGTEGARLDGITRSPLWNLELDYGHGTGHGVGAFLNVHEGPQGIHRMASKPFQAGMIVSIEPGYYQPGWGGIRLENLVVVVEKKPGWLAFETLTFIPFDLRLVDFNLLTEAESNWLKSYHQAVYKTHAKTLNKATLKWLKKACGL